MSIGKTLAITVERVTRPVEGMHRSIARGWFTVLEPAARPVRLVHDAVSATVYSAVRQGAKLGGRIVDATVNLDAAVDEAGDAFVHGLWGDHLDGSSLSMTVRDRAGAPISIVSDPSGAFPDPAPRIVVLLHGLADTEQRWHPTGDAPGLIDAIDADPDLTGVAVRYNSGLHVSTNGSLLSDLLEEIVSTWPVQVESVALVGHSMGGLVARSALASGTRAGRAWVGAVTDLITIGTPHRGSPLEKLANVAAWGLRVAPVTVPLADFIDTRSSGIKDLRFGAVLEEDWQGHDPDALLRNTVVVGPPHANVRHHFVAGVITADARSSIGRLVGDLVVRPASSGGPVSDIGANVLDHGGAHHGNLPGDQRVIDHVMGWLTTP